MLNQERVDTGSLVDALLEPGSCECLRDSGGTEHRIKVRISSEHIIREATNFETA